MAENDGSGAAEKLTFLLIGAGIGATLALLFAPKSGRELRGDIADYTKRGVDAAGEQARVIGERATELYGTAASRATAAYGTAAAKSPRLTGPPPAAFLRCTGPRERRSSRARRLSRKLPDVKKNR
jgi:hypothetical protein